MAYASIQSYPEALAGQVRVNDVPDIGLVGVTIGAPKPQSLHDGEETENDMVKSSVLAFPAVSWHLA